MLVEIHMLQNHAPSNLNRDDTGSPKDCFFGGSLRARISSQCLKRSIRRSPIFEAQLKERLGTRTRGLPKLLRDELATLGCTESECSLIAKKASAFGSGKEDEKAEETRQLIFLDPAEVSALACELKSILEREGAEGFAKLKIEDIEKQLSRKLPLSVDIALFGRMTTTSAFQDVEASMQVAHAFSTGKLDKQFDYYTGVDDLVQSSDDDEKGAGMIGDVEFNSATYYKYFSLDWDEFVDKLGGDVETASVALTAFIRAAALTTPTGKQNSFAAHNPPDAILVEIKKEKLPVSYANAFVKPIRASAEADVIEASIAALSSYSASLKEAYGIRPLASLYMTVRGEKIAGAERVATLDDLTKQTLAALGAPPAAGA